MNYCLIFINKMNAHKINHFAIEFNNYGPTNAYDVLLYLME